MTTLDMHESEHHPKPDKEYHTNIKETLRKIDSGPSVHNEPEEKPKRKQVPVDLIEEEGMESFPASDPPGHLRSHTGKEKPEPRRPGNEDV